MNTLKSSYSEEIFIPSGFKLEIHEWVNFNLFLENNYEPLKNIVLESFPKDWEDFMKMNTIKSNIITTIRNNIDEIIGVWFRSKIESEELGVLLYQWSIAIKDAYRWLWLWKALTLSTIKYINPDTVSFSTQVDEIIKIIMNIEKLWYKFYPSLNCDVPNEILNYWKKVLSLIGNESHNLDKNLVRRNISLINNPVHILDNELFKMCNLTYNDKILFIWKKITWK